MHQQRLRKKRKRRRKWSPPRSSPNFIELFPAESCLGKFLNRVMIERVKTATLTRGMRKREDIDLEKY